MHKAIEFIREAIQELKKVTWPGKKEVLGATILVAILVMILSFFVSTVDFVLALFFRQILG